MILVIEGYVVPPLDVINQLAELDVIYDFLPK